METENSSNNTSNNVPLCRYFASNICNRGDSCLFSHDRNARPNMTCTYYLAGNCAYGRGCRYDHIRPRANPTTSASSLRPSVSRNVESFSDDTQQKSEPKVATSTTNAWSKPLPYVAPSSMDHFNMASLCSDLEQIESSEFNDSFSNRRHDSGSAADIPLCPYHEMSCCINGNACTFVHGEKCDMCGANCLHPFNETQRLEHHRACLSEHEAAMEAAFAEARSINKQCGICMEIVVEKQLRFGILENCKHCYCLACIRKWRQRTSEFADKIVRSCPECRIVSDYVIPSVTWVEDAEEKGKLITLYRQNMKQKECKYTKTGTVDDCPFGNKCFYQHLRADGTSVEGESPRELQKRRRLLKDIHRDFLSDDDDESLIEEVIETIARTSSSRRRNNRENGI